MSAAAWDNTRPTENDFTVGTANFTNFNGDDFIAYLFRSIPGFSKIGSYLSNNSANGPFIALDFRPAMILVKRTNAASSWTMKDQRMTGPTFDVEGNGGNPIPLAIFPDLTNGLAAGTDVDFLANGFKIRNTATNMNTSAGTLYVFAAFAEFPNNWSPAR